MRIAIIVGEDKEIKDIVVKKNDGEVLEDIFIVEHGADINTEDLSDTYIYVVPDDSGEGREAFVWSPIVLDESEYVPDFFELVDSAEPINDQMVKLVQIDKE